MATSTSQRFDDLAPITLFLHPVFKNSELYSAWTLHHLSFDEKAAAASALTAFARASLARTGDNVRRAALPCSRPPIVNCQLPEAPPILVMIEELLLLLLLLPEAPPPGPAPPTPANRKQPGSQYNGG